MKRQFVSSVYFLIFYGSDGSRHENNHPSVRQNIVMARFIRFCEMRQVFGSIWLSENNLNCVLQIYFKNQRELPAKDFRDVFIRKNIA